MSTHSLLRSVKLSLRDAHAGSIVSMSGIALAVSSSMLSGLAYAADVAETTLDTVVVEEAQAPDANPNAEPGAPYKINTMSSPKYTRPIAETPKTITVLPKEAIEESGATDLTDVLRAQPGITLGTGEGGNAFGDRIIIRGFEARNDVFIDGLRDPGVTTRETFAVEQIEISKGPSSSFAGRGTTGGAVNLVTKKPQDQNFTQLQGGLGTDNKWRATVDSNQVLSDTMTARANLLYGEREVPARDGVSEQRQGAALAFDWQPGKDFKLTADYYYSAGDDMPDGGVPWDAVAGEPVPGRHFYGQEGRDYWDTSSNIGTLSLEYDISKEWNLTNQTRYGVTTNEYVLTIPGLGAPSVVPGTPIGMNTPGVFARASSQNRDQENTYLGNQTNLKWDTVLGGMRHTWIAGAELSKEEAENLPRTDSQRSPNAGDPLNPNNHAWVEAGGTLTPNIDRYAKLELDSWSLYLMDTVTLNQEWEVFGGLRFDTFDYSVVSGATAYTGATDGAIKNDDSTLNGHFGLVYSPWQDGNVYVGYSTSSNFNGEQIDAFTNCAYGGLCRSIAEGTFPVPEDNVNLELGTKWELVDKKMLFTAALFHITKSNVISGVGSGPAATFTQVGEMVAKGLELGLTGNITPQLSLMAGATLMDTEITESDNPAEIGQPFPNMAETSANLQLRYELNPQWVFGGTLTYTGEIFGGTPNAGITNNSLDPNTRLDLMAQYAFDKNLTLRLNVLNVTDAEYYDALYRSAAPFTYAGEGRSATVTVDYLFR